MILSAKVLFDCPACEDTWVNSRGEPCHPCLINGRIEERFDFVEPEAEPFTQGDLFSDMEDVT